MANVDLNVRSASVLASSAPVGQGSQRSGVPAGNGNMAVDASVTRMPEVEDPGVKALLEQSASSAQLVSRDLKINVDDASGKYVISVLDPETEEVIRQFPPEGALNMLETLNRIIDEEGTGSLINEKT